MPTNLTPGEILKAKTDSFSLLYAGNTPVTISNGERTYDLNVGTDPSWKIRGFRLDARRWDGELFNIMGEVTIVTDDTAIASLNYYGKDPETVGGVKLGEERSIKVASTALGHFMFADLEDSVVAVEDFEVCLIRETSGTIRLPF